MGTEWQDLLTRLTEMSHSHAAVYEALELAGKSYATAEADKKRALARLADAEKLIVSINADRQALARRSAGAKPWADLAYSMWALLLTVEDSSSSSWAMARDQLRQRLNKALGATGAVFGPDADEHGPACSWPDGACIGHPVFQDGYPRVRVPENAGKHPGESAETGANQDWREPVAHRGESWEGQ
jgi:hypothetical protein